MIEVVTGMVPISFNCLSILHGYSNNLNNKGNNTSFSVQNITTKAILKNSDHYHIGLLFVTITKTLTTQQQNYLKILIAGEKAISSMSDTSLSNLFNDLNIPLKGCSYQE